MKRNTGSEKRRLLDPNDPMARRPTQIFLWLTAAVTLIALASGPRYRESIPACLMMIVVLSGALFWNRLQRRKQKGAFLIAAAITFVLAVLVFAAAAKWLT